jgi:hypothetical protein
MFLFSTGSIEQRDHRIAVGEDIAYRGHQRRAQARIKRADQPFGQLRG